MNRGEGTPPATKSGRKVKRPAHFDDSPDAKGVASPGKRQEVAPEVKKSARKTLVLASSAGTPPPVAKNGSEPEVVKKSSRKTFAGNGSRDDSPEPEPVKKVAASSARKTLLKSAVKNSSTEGTPKKTPAKKVQETEEEAPAGSGLSRTGRKIKVPAHLKEFEDVVATSRKSVAPEVEEKPAPKTPGRAKEVPEPKSQVRGKSVVRQLATEHEPEVEEKPVAKTPGRARSFARKTVEEEEEEAKPAAKTSGRSKSMARKPSVDEEKPVPRSYGRARSVARQQEEEDKPAPPKTPGRARSMAARKPVEDEPEEVKPAPKTPGRAKSVSRKISVDEPIQAAPKTPSRRTKSIAPQIKPSQDEEDPLALPEPPVKRDPSPIKKQDKPPAKTPSKRAKSPEPPKPAASADLGEPMSRSGRKIKPKKYFGDFEQEEPLPTLVPTVASPVKSSPIRSPVKQQVVKKGSPYAPKKDSPSPVKRLSLPSQQPIAGPAKKPKQQNEADDGGSPFKISPATEERQITKRNVNDHHHKEPEAPVAVSPPKKAKLESPQPAPVSPSEPEVVAELDPLATTSSSNSSSSATSITTTATVASSSESSEQSSPPSQTAVAAPAEDKPKRGRKTLPAPSVDSDVPKAPKTPSRKTIAPVATVEEPAGSSRSGRKIKPKKFFGDEEDSAPVAVVVAAVPKAKPEASGKRKTLAAASGSSEESDKKDEDQKPQESVSREEIMAIVGDFQEATPEEEVQPQQQQQPEQTEPINGSSEEKSDVPPANSTEVDETSAESNESEQAVASEQDLPAVQAEAGDLSESAGNFPEIQIEQTPPLATPVVPDDPVPSAEEQPEAVAEIAEASASSNFSEALLVEEEAPTAAAEGEPTVEEKMEELFESVEFLEDSVLAGRLSDAAAATIVSETVPAELLDTAEPEPEMEPAVEPVQTAEPEAVPVAPEEEDLDKTEPPAALDEQPTFESEIPEDEDLNKTEPPATMDEPTFESEIPEEDDLNKTEPPATLDGTAEDVVQGADLLASAIPEGIEDYFAENDRDQESITVFPETPKSKPVLEQEEVDLIGKLPEPQQSSSNTVAIVEIPDTPMVAIKQLTPTTPKTPESKSATVEEDYSPDKPDAQEQASVPQPEIIEILDSPVITVLEPASKQGSATSTPLGLATAGKLTVKELMSQNNRKRSLSASDADLSTKKNVTFHSPANSTILVDTLDERIKKSLKSDGKTKNARKRSLSEHKELGPSSDGPKPSKVSKLPNFKNIHQNQFSRMESIQEYHNRKVQRAKEILTNSASKSPAASALVRNATPQKVAPHSGLTKPQLKFTASKPSHPVSAGAKPATPAKILSDEARQEKRQQQFKAAFKPKTASSVAPAASTGNGSSTNTTSGKPDGTSPDGSRRIVEQSRHKQHQILKGVRTNKRFELLMKFRDAAHE